MGLKVLHKFHIIKNSADRRDAQEVSEKEGQSLAFKFGCLFTELSAKESTQDDIRRVIVDLIGEIKNARKIEEIQQINGQKKSKKKA